MSTDASVYVNLDSTDRAAPVFSQRLQELNSNTTVIRPPVYQFPAKFEPDVLTPPQGQHSPMSSPAFLQPPPLYTQQTTSFGHAYTSFQQQQHYRQQPPPYYQHSDQSSTSLTPQSPSTPSPMPKPDMMDCGAPTTTMVADISSTTTPSRCSSEQLPTSRHGDKGGSGGSRRYKTPSPALLRVRRTAANARERKRMSSLNIAYDSLRNVLPNPDAGRKLSKYETLQMAQVYIASLQTLLTDDPKVANLCGY